MHLYLLVVVPSVDGSSGSLTNYCTYFTTEAAESYGRWLSALLHLHLRRGGAPNQRQELARFVIVGSIVSSNGMRTTSPIMVFLKYSQTYPARAASLARIHLDFSRRVKKRNSPRHETTTWRDWRLATRRVPSGATPTRSR
jgi:hypothetical protein